ncbi:MAG: transposase [Nitrososphaeria archaeon]
MLRENMHINMKTVKYTPYEKVVELLASMIAGCQHTVTINSKLVPDTALAEELIGKDRFADQSGINRLLQSISEDNVNELERVFSAYYLTHGMAWKKESVDVDMTGFRANGKTYENTEKGYISEKGDRGYKATFAYTDREVIGMVFGKGNEVEVNQIHGILKVIRDRIGSPKAKDIIIRGDAGFGILTIIDILYSQSFLFIVKGRQRSSAKRLSKRIKNWTQIPGSPDELAYG